MQKYNFIIKKILLGNITLKNWFLFYAQNSKIGS
jgi:hypothetical protein